MEPNPIDITTARKVLEVVDAGLSAGMGIPEPGHMCVEAAVCFAMGLPHGDSPECVSPALRTLKVKLNDENWSSRSARAKGLRRLAVAQLGSKDKLDDTEFAKRVSELAIRKSVPVVLRAAAAVHPEEKHRLSLEAAAKLCEMEGTPGAANVARTAAKASGYAAYGTEAIDATYAAASAATYAMNAAVYAPYAAGAVAYVAYADETCDNTLATFAEDVVQILIAMQAPGCQFLPLTE